MLEMELNECGQIADADTDQKGGDGEAGGERQLAQNEMGRWGCSHEARLQKAGSTGGLEGEADGVHYAALGIVQRGRQRSARGRTMTSAAELLGNAGDIHRA